MGSERKLAVGMTGRELLVLLVLAAVHFANVMDFMIVMPLGPQYQADLHIKPQEFGWLVSVYGFTSSLSGLLAAWFLDQEARRGKNPDPGAHDPATAAADRGADRGVPQHQCTLLALPPQHALAASERASSAVPPSIA